MALPGEAGGFEDGNGTAELGFNEEYCRHRSDVATANFDTLESTVTVSGSLLAQSAEGATTQLEKFLSAILALGW